MGAIGNSGFTKGVAPTHFKIENPSPNTHAHEQRITDNVFRLAFMKKKFNFIDLLLMLPAVIALIYGFVSIT
jgi:hypothetical protein